MKVAQVNVYFKPFMLGGAEWYVYNVSRELVRRGHEVHVFTADTCNGEKAPAEETIDGISVHRLPLKLDLTYRLKWWDGLHEALSGQKFDVIHAYDYGQPHSATALRAGRDSGAATVLTVFDVHSMIPRSWYKRYPMRVMEGYMSKRTLRGPDRILVRAPNLVEPLVALGGQRDKIEVTSSGVRDESVGTFDGTGFRRNHGIDAAPVVLYLGRLNPLKGPQYLIDAAPAILDRFPGTTFVLVGPEQSGFGSELLERASRVGVQQRVRILGPIYDFAEKMSAYASCDVFSLPTSYEGTSQAIFEAMAQGKPIVSTSVGGVPYQVTDGLEGYLVPFSDADALARRIIEVLGDPVLAARMGESGRKRVDRQRYSVLTSRVEEIYAEVAA